MQAYLFARSFSCLFKISTSSFLLSFLNSIFSAIVSTGYISHSMLSFTGRKTTTLCSHETVFETLHTVVRSLIYQSDPSEAKLGFVKSRLIQGYIILNSNQIPHQSTHRQLQTKSESEIVVRKLIHPQLSPITRGLLQFGKPHYLPVCTVESETDWR